MSEYLSYIEGKGVRVRRLCNPREVYTIHAGGRTEKMSKGGRVEEREECTDNLRERNLLYIHTCSLEQRGNVLNSGMSLTSSTGLYTIQ